MNRRALGIAVLFAILGVFLLLLYQRRFETEASGGERVIVLTATKDIEPGTVIGDDMIGDRPVPIAYTEDRAIKAGERQRLIGLRATTRVRAQQVILWTDILSSGEERKDLSSLVRPGYVAFPIRIAREDGSVALVRPGDYVDVFGVLSASQNSDKTTAVLLMNRVLVLASGTDTSPIRDDNRPGYANDNSVTLSVSTRDAQILALAGTRGRLSVAVRRADDTREANVTDLTSDQLLNIQRARSSAQAAPSGPQALK